MEKKRSVGVTILGVYLLLCMIPAFFTSIIGGISGPSAKNALDLMLDIIRRSLFISGPLVLFITAIGLFKLNNWARVTTMLIFPIASYVTIYIGIAIISLNAAISPDIVLLIFRLGTVVMSISIIYYLTRPKVKEQFK